MTEAAAIMGDSDERHAPSRLGEFILCRLLVGGKKTAPSDVDKAVKRFFASRLSLGDEAWRELLASTFEELRRQGYIEVRPLRLTDTGERCATTFLGLSARPSRLTWKSLRNRYLVAKALGVSPANGDQWRRLSSADGLRAAIICKHHNLPGDPLPTLAKALDRLAWDQIGRRLEFDPPLDRAFMRNEVLRVTLCKGRAVDPGKHLPAFIVRAQNSSPDKLREAIIRQWLDTQDAIDVECDLPPVPQSTDFDLVEFAEQVLKLARSSATGRFGDNKVFLAHVWDQYQAQATEKGMSREEFNQHLIEANQQNLLTLSRADLVSAMDPDDVRRSEVAWSTSTFHFVRIDGASPHV